MRFFRRIWESPRLIPVLSVMTVVALAGAAFAVFGVLAQDQARERDRLAADLASCERGNVLRLQVRALGEADQNLVTGILDIVLPSGSEPRVDVLRDQLTPVLAEHQATIEDIVAVDCQQLVHGGRPTITTFREGN